MLMLTYKDSLLLHFTDATSAVVILVPVFRSYFITIRRPILIFIYVRVVRVDRI
jgi:hypothetical protein